MMQTLDPVTSCVPRQGSSMGVGLLPENTPPIGGRVALRHRNALVVFEGASRIAWHRGTGSQWTPVGLWPRPHEAMLLQRQLADGDPLLVIVSEPVATVPLLVEELRAAPSALAQLAGPAEGHLVELHLPALDWLPEESRTRGLEFLTWTDTVMAATPYALCPPVLLERPGTAKGQIRFARPRRGERVTDADCRALVEHVFPSALSDKAGV